MSTTNLLILVGLGVAGVYLYRKSQQNTAAAKVGNTLQQIGNSTAKNPSLDSYLNTAVGLTNAGTSTWGALQTIFSSPPVAYQAGGSNAPVAGVSLGDLGSDNGSSDFPVNLSLSD